MAGVRAAARRGGDASAGDRGARWSDYFTSQVRQGLAIAAISVFLLWLVWIYGNSLRDPRYLDGWLLAAGMSLQVYFHISIKTATLSPKAATSWRKLHIFLGYVLGAVFISHSDYSLPDTAFEWALWTGFVSVTLSGIFGTYLAWAIKGKGKIDERTSFDRIPARRAEIAKEIHALAKTPDANPAAIALPAPPYHAWIVDLYTNHLQGFLQRQANSAAHLIGSQRPLKRLTDEIDNLSRYVDQSAQDKLAAMKALVVEKDRLDFAWVHLGLAKAWLLVHVPVTYGLIVMVVLHGIVVYSFSSGVW
jgi:hypothetical protein